MGGERLAGELRGRDGAAGQRLDLEMAGRGKRAPPGGERLALAARLPIDLAEVEQPRRVLGVEPRVGYATVLSQFYYNPLKMRCA